MKLCHSLLQSNYKYFRCKFYTSPEFIDILIQYKADMFATLRLNRKEMPENLQKKRKWKKEVSTHQRGNVCVMKWQNKKDISYCQLFRIHK